MLAGCCRGGLGDGPSVVGLGQFSAQRRCKCQGAVVGQSDPDRIGYLMGMDAGFEVLEPVTLVFQPALGGT